MATDLYANGPTTQGGVYELEIATQSQIHEKECDKVKSDGTTFGLVGILVGVLTLLNIAIIIVIPVLYFQTEAKWQEVEAAQKDAIVGLNGTDTDILEEMSIIDDSAKKNTTLLTKRIYELEQTIKNTTVLKGRIYELEQTMNHVTSRFIRDCSTADPRSRKVGNQSYGVFQVYVKGHAVDAFCDFITENERWTVFQRRMDGSVDFYRNYADYIKGFGNLSGEFWMGLDNLHSILQTAERFELRIDMEDWDGVKKFAKYSLFDVGKPDEGYSLTVTGHSGTAADSLLIHNGFKFSTKDHDLDNDSRNCAHVYKGAWWYSDCHHSNLNGLYHVGGPHDSFADGINWKSWKGYHYSLKFVEMKIRAVKG